jgi:DNA repair exonuclease SbcCD ATPase subunit/DNA repair exonuclease SbcCD nuclease subunit
MKIGIFSDLQLHSWRSFGMSDDDVISKRLQDQISILNQIHTIVKDNQIDVLIFGGDGWHKRGDIPVECLNVLIDWYEKISKICTVLLCRGNHDLFNDRKYHKLYDALNILDHGASQTVGLNGTSIRLVNYYDNPDYDKINRTDIVVLHKQPEMVNEYGHHFVGVDWSKLSENNRLVFFGHYHKRMRLANNCFIIGSPLPLTFDDKDDRGMYIVDTNGPGSSLLYDHEIVNDYAVAFVKLEYPKFLTVDDSASVVHGDGNYYRVLSATSKSDDANVINVVKPEYFDERIKSNNFNDVIHEWLAINKLDDAYLTPLDGIISDKIQSVKKLFGGRAFSVKAKNFLSLGDVNLKIENGFTLISGLNLDTNDSNGSGKTSLFEAIYWCLFGETTRGLTGDDVIRRGCKDCYVELILDWPEYNTCYTVSRSRKDGLSVTQQDEVEACDCTTGLKQIDRQLFLEEQVLGFDKNVFKSSCYFSQENILMFTSLSDVEKTNMLTKLLGFETYVDLYEAVFDKIKKSNLEIERIERDKQEAGNQIKNNQSKIEILDRNIANCQSNIARITSSISDCKQLILDMESYADLPVDEVDFRLLIDQKSVEIEEIEKLVEEYDRQIDDQKTKYNELNNKLILTRAERNAAMSEIEVKRSEINNLTSSESSLGEKCDKCGAVISKDNIDVFVQEKEEVITFFNKGIKDIDGRIGAITNELQDVSNKIAELQNTRLGIGNRLRVARAELKDLNDKQVQHQAKVAQFNKDKELRESKISGQRDLINTYQAQIGMYTTDIDKSQGDKNKYTELIVEWDNKASQLSLNIEDINKTINILEFWKKSFSPSGIRTLLLDRFCNEFNSVVNEYLSTVSAGTMSITVSPTKTLKSGEERNKIGLDIYMNGVLVKYESLSGGEKRRVDISICLTMNRWVRMKYQLNRGLLGILILDELFAYVDGLGEETIATVLTNEGLDKAVYVVSHTADLNSYGDRMLTVVKRNGVSELL